MLIKIKKQCQTVIGKHKSGDEVEVPRSIGQKLIDRGYGEIPGAKKTKSKGG